MNDTGYCPAATSACQAPMRGTMCWSMKARSCWRSASTRGL